jgi:hypothetical protein
MTEKELGVQPLDALMTRLTLANHDLVKASTEQLTHKMVQKGRKGRRLTPHVKTKILNALHAALQSRRASPEAGRTAVPGQKFAHRDLFNY